MSEQRFCVDCEHHRERDDEFRTRDAGHYCASTRGRHLVTGKLTELRTCADERFGVPGCGNSAMFFERRDASSDASQGATA